jgi:hypothetical protein
MDKLELVGPGRPWRGTSLQTGGDVCICMRDSNEEGDMKKRIESTVLNRKICQGLCLTSKGKSEKPKQKAFMYSYFFFPPDHTWNNFFVLIR